MKVLRNQHWGRAGFRAQRNELNVWTTATGVSVVLTALLLIAAALITLAAAVLGGKAGMHYHRKIDRAEADPALPATP
jgi:hypothetical protein